MDHMRRMAARAAVVAMAMLVFAGCAGCDDETAQFQQVVAPKTARPGDIVRARMRNTNTNPDEESSDSKGSVDCERWRVSGSAETTPPKPSTGGRTAVLVLEDTKPGTEFQLQCSFDGGRASATVEIVAVEGAAPGADGDDDVVKSQEAPELGPEEELFNNANDAPVTEGAKARITFRVTEPMRLTSIQTYHYEAGGRGVAPGSITIKDSTGAALGTWQATGSPGQGGVPNAYWNVAADLDLEPGTYGVFDSSPKTWSTNSQMRGLGQTIVRGRPLG